MKRLDDLDYYTLLGVDFGASDEEIKVAFREFARRYHPDRYVGRSERRIHEATVVYKRGSEAYQVLLNEDLKKAYIQALREGERRLSADAMHKAMHKVMTAETNVTMPKKQALPISSAQAIAQYKAGIAAAHNGDWEKAYRCLKAAHELEPDNEFIASRMYRAEGKARQKRYIPY